MRENWIGRIGRLALGSLLLSLALPLAALEPPAATLDSPYRVGGEISRPEKISGNPPVYSEMARKARIQGVVILEAVIDENGDVTDIRILKGLPMGLDQAAVEAVKTWKFKPAMLEGSPVRVFYTLTVNFQIDSGRLGPVFTKLLAGHPELASAFTNGRFEEAEQLLASASPRPSDAEITLARAHLLLARGRVQEAWQLAETERFANPSAIQEELALAVAGAVLDKQWRRAPQAERPALLELGLQATHEALSAVPESVTARSIRASLLQAKLGFVTSEEAPAIAEEISLLHGEIQALTEPASRPAERPGAEITLSMGRDPDAPLTVGGEVTAPERISGKNAQYTEVARKARLQGTVLVKAIVDEEGNVIDAWVMKGLPMGLDKQALEAVRTYKFRPATRHGKPVRVYHTVPVEFAVM